jgi:hypothetical protein
MGDAAMPVKDLAGPPRKSAAQRAAERRLIAEIRARFPHLPWNRFSGGREEPDAIGVPRGPRPLPLSGAAALDLPE